MTQSPEYGQVAGWLRAINPDAGYLEGLEAGYYDIKYAADNGLTLETYVIERWQWLADRARRALDGIDPGGRSLDEVAGAYHDKQIAEHAVRQRALRQRIRTLKDEDFEPPSWCADEAAAAGISLEQAIEGYRHDQLLMAEEELARLFEGDVREEEAEAWRARRAGNQTAAKDTMTAGPGRDGFPAAGEATTVTNETAALKPDPARVPTASQAGYAKVMAEAARHHKTRLAAQADQACKAARAAGWEDKNANQMARRAVHAADMAVRHWGAAESWKWHVRWQEPRRDAMLAWYGQHPGHGQGAETVTGAESPITPAAKADLGRLFRAAADLMEQAGAPGLEVSCWPGHDEITIRVPEDSGDIGSRIAVIDRLAAITGGESSPVPPYGDTCDWIEAAGQFAGHPVHIFTPSGSQPGKPPRPDRALKPAPPARQTISNPAAELDRTTPPGMRPAGTEFRGRGGGKPARPSLDFPHEARPRAAGRGGVRAGRPIGQTTQPSLRRTP
jgi:hypothetical protein